MHADYERMTLPELADQLEDLDGRRTPVGWTPEDAQERATLERLILSMVSEGAPAGKAEPIRCDFDIRLRSKEQAVAAKVLGLVNGGILVESKGEWIVGTHVEMEIRQSANDEHGLRARGVITKLDGKTARISVAEQPSEAHERRLRRFILELIRHRIHN